MTKAVLLLLIVFFIYSLTLINKYPLVTPDETWFANYAYSLTGKETLSSTPFEHRLPTIDKDAQIAYGPVYPLILSLPLRFFPYGLTTTRFTSIFIGTLTVLSAFLLSKFLFKSTLLAFLSALLLSIDYSFLLRARFVRPEILVMLFGSLALLFYSKTWENPKAKYFFLTGLFISLGIFSHFFIGVIPALTIILHYFLNRNLPKKNHLLIILPTIFFSLAWILFINSQDLQPHSVWQILFSKRITPSFQLLTSFPTWDLHGQIIFAVYLLSFFSLLISKVKLNIKSLYLLFFLITFAVFSFGNSVVYEGLLSLPAILCLVAKPRKFLFPIFLTALILTNIYGQALILIITANFSYASFGQAISKALEPQSKVFIKFTNPDPYVYLAEKRPDLKLDYFQLFNKDNYGKSLSEADYIITHGYDLVFLENYKKSRKSLVSPFDLALTKFLEANENKIQVISNLKTIFPYNTVVIKIQK